MAQAEEEVVTHGPAARHQGRAGPGRVEVTAECRGLGRGEQKSTANLGALETTAR